MQEFPFVFWGKTLMTTIKIKEINEEKKKKERMKAAKALMMQGRRKK